MYQSLFKYSCMPQPATVLKKEALAQLFSCEFCEVFMSKFFCRTLPVAASAYEIQV